MDHSEILKKVLKEESDRPFLLRCLDVFICPECGGKLDIDTQHPYLTMYICKDCNFTRYN